MSAAARVRVSLQYRNASASEWKSRLIEFGECLVELLQLHESQAETTEENNPKFESSRCNSASKLLQTRATPEVRVVFQEKRNSERMSLMIFPQAHAQYLNSTPNAESDNLSANTVFLGHACDCPSQQGEAYLDTRHSYMGLGVVCLLWCRRSNKILLTRRPKHMRTFPRAWVLPGGGVDIDDVSLRHAAARELFEETGVRVHPEDGVPLGMWESVYPTTK
mmetsp:Transcript_661/g.807  ORF Transcript_661/g.807 Transcript_661/m.807 type:complete len:221 (+) Transcript_661:204-866(+)